MLLTHINYQLSSSQKLRLEEMSPQILPSFWVPEVFTAGVHQAKEASFLALREFVGLWSGWLVVGFMLGGVLGRRSFGGL